MSDHDDSVARLRVPPHSTEAEQSVLGSLLLDNSAWDRVGDVLVEESFFENRHRLVFAALYSLINAGKAADIITVHERLQVLGKDGDVGGLPYLNTLSNSVPSAANIRHYAEIVADRALSRELIAKTDEAATLCFGSTVPATEKADRIALMFDQVQARGVRRKPVLAGEIMVRQLDHVTDLSLGHTQPGIPLHLMKLTEALNGGLRPGKVIVLAARPSVGKSSLAASLLLGVAKDYDHSVLFLSQEMESSEVIDRLACNLGQIDYERYQRGHLNEFEWGSLSEAVEVTRNLRFYVDDQPSLTLGEIRAKAMALRRENLKAIAIDYLQLCNMEREKGQTDSSAIGRVSGGIKKLAKDLGLTIILLSQLNRDVEKRSNPEPTLADLRDSGAIEQDADIVMFLWRVRQWSDRQIMGCSLPKNRQGKAGARFALEFMGQYQRWYDSDADISPSKPESRSANDKGFNE